MTGLAGLPDPPYYAVIFTSVRTHHDHNEYQMAAAEMERLARTQPGCLGIESARDDETRTGITVSYWTDEQAITAWRTHAEHVVARRLGRERWYCAYRLRVARVERAYGWTTAGSDGS